MEVFGESGVFEYCVGWVSHYSCVEYCLIVFNVRKYNVSQITLKWFEVCIFNGNQEKLCFQVLTKI